MLFSCFCCHCCCRLLLWIIFHCLYRVQWPAWYGHQTSHFSCLDWPMEKYAQQISRQTNPKHCMVQITMLSLSLASEYDCIKLVPVTGVNNGAIIANLLNACSDLLFVLFCEPLKNYHKLTGILVIQFIRTWFVIWSFRWCYCEIFLWWWRDWSLSGK